MSRPIPDLHFPGGMSVGVADPLNSARIAGAWHCDAKLRFSVTASAAPFFGLGARAALEGAPLSAYLPAIHPEDREWLASRIRMQSESGQVAVAQFRTIGTGSVRWILSRGQYFRDESGGFLGGSGILIDGTDAQEGGEHSMYAAPASAGEDPLMRLSAHALGLRYAIDAIGDEPALRSEADRLLRSVGFAIARRIRDGERQLN